MTKQHKATPEQWAYAETCAPEDFAGYACILELRDRIEALEVGQQPPQDKLDRLIALDRDDPTNSLVERVVGIIGLDPVGDGKARAAIREVAAALLDWWDSDEVARTGWEAAKWLEQKADQ
jgi:hypothetical protein